MSDHSRMEVKIDEIQRDVSEIKTTLAVNTESLKQHMRRTDLLESKVDSIWQKALTIVSLISGLAVLGRLLLGG
jgi:hypothetical protein